MFSDPNYWLGVFTLPLLASALIALAFAHELLATALRWRGWRLAWRPTGRSESTWNHVRQVRSFGPFHYGTNRTRMYGARIWSVGRLGKTVGITVIHAHRSRSLTPAEADALRDEHSITLADLRSRTKEG